MSIQNDSIISENDNEEVDESENSDESHESDDENLSQESDVSESENEFSDSDNQDHKNDDRSHKTGDKKPYKSKDDSNDENKKQLAVSDDKDTSLNEVRDIDNNDHKSKYNIKKQSKYSDAIEPSLDEGNVIEQNDVETSKNAGSNCSKENADETSDQKDSVISSISDDGLEEEQMVMSRATRMSIMGVIPKENDSDDSDFIESDDTAHSSRANSSENLYMGPYVEETHGKTTPETPTKVDDGESSSITCSPITSPSHNVTNEINGTFSKNDEINNSLTKNDQINDSLTKNDSKVCNDNLYSPEVCDLKKKVLNKVNKEAKVTKEKVIDDDVTIIDNEPEVIALSSDDEVEVKEDKSPNRKKSPIGKATKEESQSTSQLKSSDIKQYLPPPSYPNQIVYVKKHVRENELSKLNGIREDLQNVRYLLDNMDVESLPDRGAKLMERLDALERDVQRQGEEVASMVVEPGH